MSALPALGPLRTGGTEEDVAVRLQGLTRFFGGRAVLNDISLTIARGEFVTLIGKSGAADGFNVMPPVLPALLEDFIEHVVPILPKRGLSRQEYEGGTLRAHYGLERPANPYFEAQAG